MSNAVVFEGSQSERIRANLEAVREIKSTTPAGLVDAAERNKALAGFSGWGGLTALFDESNPKYADERAELVDLVGEDGLHALGRGVLDSYYTPPALIEAIWAGVVDAGFEGGRVLEPGCGAGYFRRCMPADLEGKVQMVGVEKDAVAAAVAGALHSDMQVIEGGFEDASFVNGSFDLALGNVPFGDFNVSDALHRNISRFSIHSYFLAKSILKVRPGGVAAFVISRYFMDSSSGAQARQFMHRHAELLGAVRLPAGVFSGAGTDVVADVVVFQRRGAALKGSIEDWPDWVDTEFVNVDGDTYRLSRYFNGNSADVLGEFATRPGQYGPTLTVKKPADLDLWGELAARLAVFASNAARATGVDEVVDEAIGGRAQIDSDLIEAAEERQDGELIALDDGRIAECVSVGGGHLFVDSGLAGKRAERARGMVELAGLVGSLLAAEADNDRPAMDRLRNSLNAAYDAFVKVCGPINGWANQLVFRVDPRNPLIASLEDNYEDAISAAKARKMSCPPREASWEKAAIFSRPVNIPQQPRTPRTPQEALVRSLVEYGEPRVDVMASWLDVRVDELADQLTGKMFHDPMTGKWMSRETYLAGNVRKKLFHAKLAASMTDGRYAANVAALEEAMPKDISAADIFTPLNAPWLPGAVLAEFFEHILGDKVGSLPKIVSGEWLLDLPVSSNDRVTKVWGTDRRPAYDLIDRVMNNRSLEVYDTVYQPGGAKIRVFNADETAAAQAKAEELREEWNGWIWSCPVRRRELERLYNDTHNTHANIEYDGTFLADDKGRLPGMSGAISLRDSQLNAVWQSICVGSTLFDHHVGAGKTFAAVAQAMEMRRMGLINKALMVVPNHLVMQWGAEAQRLYPNARILCATRKDCERRKRQRLFARIATGEWDIVIIAHSSFKFMQPPKAAQLGMLEDMAFDIAAEVGREGSAGSTGYRRLQARLEKIRGRMERLMDAPSRDGFVSFDQLGIDHITVDEAQDFKNLFYTTSFHGMLGLGPQDGSQAAFDLFCKARWLQDRTGGRGLTLLTGTPLSNTVAELWHFLRYLDYPALRERGIDTFDAWARVHAQPTESYELAVSGEYKLVTRFQSFQNMPELMTLYRHYAHVVTRDDLLAAGDGFGFPAIRGGKPEMVVCTRSDGLSGYMAEILERCHDLPGKDPRDDNMLKIMSDARKAALDMRLIDPTITPDRADKVRQCALRVLREYLRWNDQKGTQLVFCDLGVPQKRTQAVSQASSDDDDLDSLLASFVRFSVYDEIRNQLMGWGVPEAEIAFAQDAKTDEQTQALQERVRRGDVRVLIGSTRKMGTGMNVQNRLVALHNLDAPWRPSDLEQRIGRIERCGNELYAADPDNFEIAVFNYGTERTLDARMWQTLETKARFIAQVRAGSVDREIKDIGGQTESAGAMKACLSGNPLILAHFEVNSELEKLTRQKRSHTRRVLSMQDSLEKSKGWREQLEAARNGWQVDTERVARNPAPVWEASGSAITGSGVAAAIERSIAQWHQTSNSWHRQTSYRAGTLIGQYRGFDVYIWLDIGRCLNVTIAGDLLCETFDFRPPQGHYGTARVSGAGLCRRMNNAIGKLDSYMQWREKMAEQTRKDRISLKAAVNQPFRNEARLDVLKTVLQELTAALSEGLSELPDSASDDARSFVTGATASSSTEQETQNADTVVLRAADVLNGQAPINAQPEPQADEPESPPPLPSEDSGEPVQASLFAA